MSDFETRLTVISETLLRNPLGYSCPRSLFGRAGTSPPKEVQSPIGRVLFSLSFPREAARASHCRFHAVKWPPVSALPFVLTTKSQVLRHLTSERHSKTE